MFFVIIDTFTGAIVADGFSSAGLDQPLAEGQELIRDTPPGITARTHRFDRATREFVELTLSEVDMTVERALGLATLETLAAPRFAVSPRSMIRLRKAQEAAEVAGGRKTSPLLLAEARQRNMSERELATIIQAKAAAENAALGAIEADYQAAQAEIDAARSPAEIDAVLSRYRP